MVAAMNRMKYDAVSLGRCDFILGTGFLAKSIAQFSFPVIASNLDDPKGRLPGTRRYGIIEIAGGKKAAVIGIMPVDALMNLGDLEGVSDLVVQPPVSVIKELVPMLRKKADMILLLSQASTEETHHIIEDVTGIDLVIASDPKASHPGERQHHATDAPVGCAGSYGQVVGAAVVRLTPGGKNHVRLENPIVLDKNIPEDESIRAIVAEITKASQGCPEGNPRDQTPSRKELMEGLKLSPHEYFEKMKQENKNN